MMKAFVLVSALALGAAAGTAQATTMVPLSGIFHINIYSGAVGTDATESNVGASAMTSSITYTGLLDFAVTLPQSQSGTTIAEFLATGTGSYVVDSGAGALGNVLSQPSFAVTTLFDITGGMLSAAATSVSLTHDDGVSFCQASCDASYAGPTSVTTNAFSATGGSYRIIYAATNGNPSVLQGMAAVPVPAAGVLLMGGLAGFGVLKRRRRAA